MNGKPWTKGQDRFLLQGIGNYGYRWLQKKTGDRTKRAIQRRAAKLLSSGVTRGTYTVNWFVRMGYSRSHIVRAREALKQKWQRTGPRGAHLITEDQMQEILEWLKHDFWCKSKQRYCCGWCATETRQPYALGLCRRCYDLHRSECKQRGLPSCLVEQKELVERVILEEDFDRVHVPFLDEAQTQFQKGLALTVAQLDWLEMLAPGGSL